MKKRKTYSTLIYKDAKIFDEINEGIIFLEDTPSDIDVVDYLDKYRAIIHDRIVECAEFTVNFGIDTIPILYMGESYSVHFDYSTFGTAMAKSLAYYESVEDFEKCAQIMELIDRNESINGF